MKMSFSIDNNNYAFSNAYSLAPGAQLLTQMLCDDLVPYYVGFDDLLPGQVNLRGTFRLWSWFRL